jgi:muramoyltetrapeptide carboxypeptidase
MPLDIEKKSQATAESLRQNLFQKPYDLSYKSKFPSISGSCQGELIGGNLSVLFSVLQTIPVSAFSEKILILEDLDEYLYHIDRMMLNLYRTGILKVLRGILVGGMSSMNDNSIPFGLSAYEIIDYYTNKLNIPVAYDAPFGHLSLNLALTLGRKATLTVTGNEVNLKY